jgi:hypothetical protein
VSILLSSCGVYWIGLFVCLPWILPTSKLDEVIFEDQKVEVKVLFTLTNQIYYMKPEDAV